MIEFSLCVYISHSYQVSNFMSCCLHNTLSSLHICTYLLLTISQCINTHPSSSSNFLFYEFATHQSPLIFSFCMWFSIFLLPFLQGVRFPKLKGLYMSLPNVLMSTFDILEFIKAADCYPNVLIAYRIFLTMLMTFCI
jgi:hypothetical protein